MKFFHELQKRPPLLLIGALAVVIGIVYVLSK